MIKSAHATLNLGAATRNLERIRQSAPSSKIMAVIKANAYGHGLIRMAQSLPTADAFAVARLDEGIALREAGIRHRITVLQGFTNAFELQLHVALNLEPVVHHGQQVELLESTPLEKPLGIWVKLDTGMHRLGILKDQFKACYNRLDSLKMIRKPIPIMTHLANADMLHDSLTERQLANFQDAVKNFNTEFSIANSAGVLAWENARADWVRPGIALYGVSPFPYRTGTEDGLSPIMTFRTRLIAIKEIESGASVGYGGDWICPHLTRLGVAAVGYGDGYPRHAQPGTPVLIRGKRVPLIGRVSMDMITMDLTDCPDARIEDEVILWGEGLPVEEIARHTATIPYDLLCGITQRVKMLEV